MYAILYFACPNTASGSAQELTLPFDDSKFIGVELSEASLNGKEPPIYHCLGLNSSEEAHKYLADKHNKFVQESDKINANVAAEKAKEEAKEAAAAQAQFYALMTKKYGAKAVAAMKKQPSIRRYACSYLA